MLNKTQHIHKPVFFTVYVSA